MIVLIAATNTVKNGDALRSRAILKHNVSPGWPRGANQPFKLKAGDDVIQLLVAVVVNRCRVKSIKASGDDYGAHLHLHNFILLFKIDGSDFAEFLAGTTFALQEIDAVLTVNDREHCVYFRSEEHTS